MERNSKQILNHRMKIKLKFLQAISYRTNCLSPEFTLSSKHQIINFLLCLPIIEFGSQNEQDQDQDSLLVKRRNDNHSPGPVIRELVPSSHQTSELSNTILCIFSG